MLKKNKHKQLKNHTTNNKADQNYSNLNLLQLLKTEECKQEILDFIESIGDTKFVILRNQKIFKDYALPKLTSGNGK